MLEINRCDKISFSCGVEYEGKIFFASMVGNDLFAYDKSKKNTKYVLSFDKEKDISYLYRCAVLYNGYAWFIPQIAENIAIVNLETFAIEYISLSCECCEEQVVLKYSSAKIIQGNKLCMVPFDVDTLTIINMETKKVEGNYRIADKERKYTDVFMADDCIYCIPWIGNELVKINLLDSTKEIFPWKFGEKKNYLAVEISNQSEIWFTAIGAEQVIFYDTRKKQWGEFPLKKENESIVLQSVYGKVVGESIFFLPYNEKKIIRIHCKKKEICEYHIADSEFPDGFYKIIDSQKLCMSIEGTNYIFFYDEEKDIFISEKLEMPVDSKSSYLINQKVLKGFKKDKIITEGYYFGMNNFIDIILKEDMGE